MFALEDHVECQVAILYPRVNFACCKNVESHYYFVQMLVKTTQ
jgi:hypothetical protein